MAMASSWRLSTQCLNICGFLKVEDHVNFSSPILKSGVRLIDKIFTDTHRHDSTAARVLHTEEWNCLFLCGYSKRLPQRIIWFQSRGA